MCLLACVKMPDADASASGLDAIFGLVSMFGVAGLTSSYYTNYLSVVAPDGVYTDNLTFNVSCCVTAIMKVVMTVELLVPSYGYATIPPCQEYTQDVCSGFFDLPIYPQNG